MNVTAADNTPSIAPPLIFPMLQLPRELQQKIFSYLDCKALDNAAEIPELEALHEITRSDRLCSAVNLISKKSYFRVPSSLYQELNDWAHVIEKERALRTVEGVLSTPVDLRSRIQCVTFLVRNRPAADMEEVAAVLDTAVKKDAWSSQPDAEVKDLRSRAILGIIDWLQSKDETRYEPFLRRLSKGDLYVCKLDRMILVELPQPVLDQLFQVALNASLSPQAWVKNVRMCIKNVREFSETARPSMLSTIQETYARATYDDRKRMAREFYSNNYRVVEGRFSTLSPREASRWIATFAAWRKAL